MTPSAKIMPDPFRIVFVDTTNGLEQDVINSATLFWFINNIVSRPASSQLEEDFWSHDESLALWEMGGLNRAFQRNPGPIVITQIGGGSPMEIEDIR